MNSVQEHKNELEAAVRYCESAISRAQATIESMEFRQQAATKAWHEQTGREAALEREVRELKNEVAALEQSEHDLKFQYSEAKTNMALMTDELEELRGIIDRMGDDSTGDSVTIKQLYDENDRLKAELEERISEVADLKVQQQASASVEALQIALSEKDQTIALQRDQIAMFQRKMSRLNEVDR